MQPKDSGSGNPRLQLPTEAETCHSLVKGRGDMVKNPLGSQPTTSRIFQDFRKSAVNVLPNVMGKWRFSLKFKGILGLFTKMDRLILDFRGTGLHSIKYIYITFSTRLCLYNVSQGSCVFLRKRGS